MNFWQEQVLEFHKKFHAHIADKPQYPPDHVIELRLNLIREEFEEVEKAIIERHKLPYLAKELVDLIYVVCGTAVAYGINLAPVMNEVHASNMKKERVGGGYMERDDGKIMKPEGWTPPDVYSVLKAQGYTE